MEIKAVCVLKDQHDVYPYPHDLPDLVSGVNGLVVFESHANGQVLIKGTFTGLARGKHGLHVCTFGNLFNGYHSTGPHFNPRKKLHGGQQDKERHVGDLGNVEANEEGVAEFQIEDQLISLSGAESIIGRSMVDTEEVFVKGTIEGLKPGKHGLYVCALGNITNGCISSGTHYNPCDKKHGGPEDPDRHVGDLGNIEANDDGVATFEMHDRLLRLAGNYSVIGRTLVVTENEDDLGKGENEDSVATGNAGNGLAWGIIGIANK
ncbi:superoxide dismutase [Cu-Zn]-like isoform X2 [Scyliorhinus canicula]|uniref:superoxide dismutase [Cu-Zn]-like isoform X2 n=1 Tax=Scyliorhinus canicula TaxID=7830 RepID=UPI0018F3780E|nr:superoxide dismutase [Cu-Zn]-like isoform X2 [Scyliorhinus canicula]